MLTVPDGYINHRLMAAQTETIAGHADLLCAPLKVANVCGRRCYCGVCWAD